MNNINNIDQDYTSLVDLEASAESKGGEFKQLEDGTHDAVICGVVSRMMDTTNDKGVKSSVKVYELIYQVIDEEGSYHFLKSKALKPSLNEKSNLFKMMKTWLKASTAKDIIDALAKAKITSDKGFNFTGFIGKPCRLSTAAEASKKDATKMYPQIGSVLPAKKQFAISTKEGVPEYMLKDNIGFKLADGLTVKSKTSKDAVIMPDEATDDLPF